MSIKAIQLFLIGLLASLGFASAQFPDVSVPAGAQAGDLTLEACTLGEGDDAVTAECGTLVVPENRSDPDSRLIALPVALVRARSDAPGAPVFNLNGGPGSSNLVGTPPPWLAENHDVIAVGYRGADGSVILETPRVEQAMRGKGGDLLGDVSLRNLSSAMAEDFAELTSQGVDITGYNIPEVVADMEAARVALGYDTVDLLSASYGTRVAQYYAALFPEAIHRSLMIAVNPPGRMVWEPEMLDRQLEYLSDLCAQNPECSSRTSDLAETIRTVSNDMPRRWLFLPIDPGKVKLASFTMLSVTPPEWVAAVFHTFIAAERGDASGLAALTLAFTLPPFDLTKLSNWGDLIAKGMTDFDPERDYLSDMNPPDTILGSPHSLLFFGAAQLEPPGLGALPSELRQPIPSDVETLLVSGSIDLSTPAVYATDELLPSLTNGEQVILSEFGHLDFYTPPEAFERLVLSFLDNGEADVSLYQAKTFSFDPAFNFPLIGKLIAAAIVGIPLLLIAIVLFIVSRVRRRRRRSAQAGPVTS